MTGLLTFIGAAIAVIVLAVGVGSIFAYFKEIEEVKEQLKNKEDNS